MGAPTGSGKTIMSELAILRLFDKHPGAKVIYIAPLKALVRERMEDWGRGMMKALGKSMVELTGDFTPDMRALLEADLIICTPEKWDGISRSWQTRGYVKRVGLLVIDEIHLLGGDRGPILEVIVSRMRYIAAQTGAPVRFVGLSTALANAEDLGSWLGVGKAGLFNFKPSVRPVPMEVSGGRARARRARRDPRAPTGPPGPDRPRPPPPAWTAAPPRPPRRSTSRGTPGSTTAPAWPR